MYIYTHTYMNMRNILKKLNNSFSELTSPKSKERNGQRIYNI